MTELVITRGIPASGKSTWAREWVTEDYLHRARVNRDDLRLQLYGRPSPLPYALEEAVSRAEEGIVRELLGKKISVVVDSTHTRIRYVRRWLELARDLGVVFRIREFSTDVKECIQRDLNREHSVGEKVIRDMAFRMKQASRELPALLAAPTESAVYVPDENLPRAWLVDIDGTLAKMNGRSPYDYTRVSEDLPNQKVIDLVDRLRFGDYVIIIISGRDGTEQCYEDTENWLGDHEVYYEALFLRQEGDKRKDSVIKQEIFFEKIAPHYNVVGVLDDRNQVVRMWRSLGLLCCQVAEGAF